MTDREKLIDILILHWFDGMTMGQCADMLLANGVIAPPCKVGDKVYVVSRYYAGDWEFYKCKIDNITIYEKNTFIACVSNDIRFGRINFGVNISELGKTVFLTKEDAEEKLRELEDNA